MLSLSLMADRSPLTALTTLSVHRDFRVSDIHTDSLWL
jgi:hypothetical protein